MRWNEHRVWTDGRRIAVIWHNGHVCTYEHVPGGAPELSTWHDPDDAERAARWAATLGWPAGANSAAGAWSLHSVDGGTQRLQGPEPPDPTILRTAVDATGTPPAPSIDLERVSAAAHLVHSDAGTVLVDAQRGIVWSLEAGVVVQLEGVHEEWGLQAVRVPGGVVVHAAHQHRSGVLLHIDDDGASTRTASPYGFTGSLGYAQGRVFATIAVGGRWLLPDGEWVDVEATGQMFCHLDERAQLLLGEDLNEVPLDYDLWVSHFAAPLWVATNGRTLVILEHARSWWGERADRVAPPVGDPTQLQGPPRLAREPAVHWEGPPGSFEVQTTVRNVGMSRVGMHVALTGPDTTQVTAMTLGEEHATVQDGLARFGRAPLPYDVAVPLTLTGRVTGPGTLGLRACWEASSHLAAEELGSRTFTFVVRSEVTAARGSARLPLDPAWIAELARRGVLDSNSPEPDLARWLPRALSRCRVQAVEDDPDGVRDAWLRMTERDREASTDGRVRGYKLATGRHWRITDPEAALIADTVGPRHPLGAFAAGGAFDVVGPDPLV